MPCFVFVILNIGPQCVCDVMNRLLEKEFQVWRVAAQSEHDSLEDKCTELKSMMEALNQHNQHLEEELDRVRHVRIYLSIYYLSLCTITSFIY